MQRSDASCRDILLPETELRGWHLPAGAKTCPRVSFEGSPRISLEARSYAESERDRERHFQIRTHVERERERKGRRLHVGTPSLFGLTEPPPPFYSAPLKRQARHHRLGRDELRDVLLDRLLDLGVELGGHLSGRDLLEKRRLALEVVLERRLPRADLVDGDAVEETCVSPRSVERLRLENCQVLYR